MSHLYGRKLGVGIESVCVGFRNEIDTPSKFVFEHAAHDESWRFAKIFRNYGTLAGKHPITCACTNFCSDDTCPNRRERVECHSCIPRCQNQRLKRNQVLNSSHLYAWIDVDAKEKGTGLRCKVPIQADTMIGEYCGHVRPDEQYKDFHRAWYQFKKHQYGFFVGHDVVDGTDHASIIRNANHSCKANATIEKWSVAGELRLILVATECIPAHTEITYNYYSCNPQGMELMNFECGCAAEECPSK